MRGLTVDFNRNGAVESEGRQRALTGVDLDIDAGERVALLGRSGAGKSTLLRCLLGAVPATGRVRVGDLDPYSGADVRRVRRATGMLRQGDDLILGMSAALNATLGSAPGWRARDWLSALFGRVPARCAARLAELADRHDIADCMTAPVADLSGGQRRRVALIRALIAEPALLLADEPTTGLDPVTVTETVRALHEAPATVIVATHDLAVAGTFERVIALRGGRVVYDGAPVHGRDAEELYR